MRAPDIQSYWDRKIVEWEDSTRTRSNISPVERLAARFRRPVVNRAELVLGLLAPQVPGKMVLELGCGSGFFAVRLHKLARTAGIVGLDFSPAAIERAKRHAKSEGVADAVSFRLANVGETTLPEADFTIGLGLLDYLDQQEIRTLFGRIGSPQMLFTFSRSDLSPLRLAHMLYLATQRCPKHFYYSEDELRSLIGPSFGRLNFLTDRRRMSFGGIVHNLQAHASDLAAPERRPRD